MRKWLFAFVLLFYFSIQLNAQTSSINSFEFVTYCLADTVDSSDYHKGVFIFNVKKAGRISIWLSLDDRPKYQPNGADIKLSSKANGAGYQLIVWNGKNGKGILVEDDSNIQLTYAFTSQEDSSSKNISIYYHYNCDLDRDGIINHLDADADNDGILNIDECFGVDPYLDKNKNLVPNYIDPKFRHFKKGKYRDINQDGINDIFDQDNDDKPNFLDFDSDNDGIFDIRSVKIQDSNDDGEIDNIIDEDGDGADDNLTYKGKLPDYDKDFIPDFCDADADNDGMPNFIEAIGLTDKFKPTGIDKDHDGIDDKYDKDFRGKSLKPIDFDNSGKLDFLEKSEDGIQFDMCQIESGKFFSKFNSFACVEEIIPGSCVDLDLSSSIDPNGKVLTYEWDFGDGTKKRGIIVSHCYQNLGTYKVKLNIYDPKTGALIQANESDVSVAAEDTSKLSFSIPDSIFIKIPFEPKINIKLPIAYSIKEVRWNFGDGDFSCEFEPSYNYYHAGEYNVTCVMKVTSGFEDFQICTSRLISVYNPNQESEDNNE